MDYLLDTNIVLNLIRKSPLSEQLRLEYSLFKSSQRLFISIVVEGELESIALQNEWGKPKIKELTGYLDAFMKVDIRIQSIIKRYAEIDAFSQGKLKNLLLNTSSRNMGKNDLWIAATASVLKIPLMTTDNDFNHLDNVFLKLIKVGI
jgi:tRNA(fMet)-specific endonuclease VapC